MRARASTSSTCATATRRWGTLPVASDVTVQVYDCGGRCALIPWSYSDLVSGRALPHGSTQSPFTVTIADGAVTSITKVYLP